MRPDWVVKLGGSLAGDPSLQSWLELIALCARTARIVIVPGGGCFANEVRRQQSVFGYDDRAAHDMAILAMAQTATAIASLVPSLQIADDYRRIGDHFDHLRAVVWRPLDIVQGAEDIEPGWDITADSLALWLAKKIDARGLLLVKSCVLDAYTKDLHALAECDVVDGRFPAMARDARCRIEIIHRSEISRGAALLTTSCEAV